MSSQWAEWIGEAEFSFKRNEPESMRCTAVRSPPVVSSLPLGLGVAGGLPWERGR